MYNQLQQSTNIAFLPTILDQDIQHAFFKCRKWQLEETLDPINCPYHYYCTTRYFGDYPSWVDNLAMFFTALSFLTTIIAMAVGVVARREVNFRRYFLPSGPIFLPIILVILANGNRINTLFPLTHTGPAILQLVRISALSFDTKSVSDIRYVFLEASTMSGILQAALYLDSIILPYYTGLDALISSRLSGECLSCICREQVLVAGGMLVYRGWSGTTALVVGTLTLRIFSRLAPENRGGIMFVKIAMESLSWILMIVESLYLLVVSPPERSWIIALTFSAVFVLVSFELLRRLIAAIISFYNGNQETQRDSRSVYITDIGGKYP